MFHVGLRAVNFNLLECYLGNARWDSFTLTNNCWRTTLKAIGSINTFPLSVRFEKERNRV